MSLCWCVGVLQPLWRKLHWVSFCSQVIGFTSETVAAFIAVVGILSILAQVSGPILLWKSQGLRNGFTMQISNGTERFCEAIFRSELYGP